jgi:hypothetical protein
MLPVACLEPRPSGIVDVPVNAEVIEPMSIENVDPRASRIVYAIVLAAGYGAVLFFLLFMFRTVLWPSLFVH